MVFAEEQHAGEVDKMLRKPGELMAFRHRGFWKPMDTRGLRTAAPKRYAQMYGRAAVAGFAA